MLIMMLAACAATAGTLADLQAEGVIKLYHDYRAGHLDDLSGNDNHGVATNLHWSKGVRFPTSTSKITVADSPELQLTEGALIVYGDFLSQETSESLFCKWDVGGINYYFYLTDAPRMLIYDGVANRQINKDITGNNCLAANIKNGNPVDYYVDGLFVASSTSMIVSVDDAPLLIGNCYANDLQSHSTFYAALVINRELSESEMSSICSDLQSIQYPTQVTSRAAGSYGVELVSNGDFEIGDPPTGWGAGASATLSSQPGNALGGSSVIRIARNGANNPSTFQSILTAGKSYRFLGWTRSDGSAVPKVYWHGSGFAWQGTVSTSWQSFDFIQNDITATSATLYAITSTGVEYTEFDNISITEIETNRTDWKTDWGSIADSVTYNTPGQKIGGVWTIIDGSWRIVTDEINGTMIKALECVSAGSVYVSTSEFQQGETQAAYGTYSFWMKQDSGGATFPKVYFIAKVAGIGAAAGQYAYAIAPNHLQAVRFRESTNGIEVSLTSSTPGVFVAGEWFKIKVMRRTSDGKFITYLNGVSGIIPDVTDNTTTASNYIVVQLSTGDSISLSDLKGNHSIYHQHGVN